MAELTTVARPYAEAVFRAAVDAGDVAGFGARLKSLGLVAADRQMSSTLGNPRVSAKEKADLMAAVVGEQLQPVVANLVAMLIENGKTALLPFITEHFERLQREHDSMLKATITSAFALSEADKASLVEALARKYGKRIEAEVRVDESLIGGARVQVGDDVVHASVRDTLEKMKHALTA
jgi:F-type H+-transporting ATPase subunit delta